MWLLDWSTNCIRVSTEKHYCARECGFWTGAPTVHMYQLKSITVRECGFWFGAPTVHMYQLKSITVRANVAFGLEHQLYTCIN
jgi:hypothetical protein